MTFRLSIYYFMLMVCPVFYGQTDDTSNMYDLSGWTIGTGNILDFTQYGGAVPNSRELGFNHIGEEVVLWKSTPNPASYAEGGIYGAYKVINNTNTYRLSVWMKKTNSNSGTSHFGLHSYTAGSHQTLDLSGSLSTNPYFWIGDLPKLNHWYLLVGYIHPHNFSGAPIGKIYDGETGEVVLNTHRDFKFSSVANNLRIRALLWNTPNLDDRQFYYHPRMELVDGTEWSLNQLLSINPDSKLLFAYDNAGNQKQRFYCEISGCSVPNLPAGRIAPEDTVVSKEAKTSETEEAKLEKDISLYPNPTKGIVSLKLNSNSDITLSHFINVYNNAGILVREIDSDFKNNLEIDLSSLPSGTYLVHVHLSDGKSITKKIIKE